MAAWGDHSKVVELLLNNGAIRKALDNVSQWQYRNICLFVVVVVVVVMVLLISS